MIHRLEKDRRVKTLNSLTAIDIASLLAGANQSSSDDLNFEVPFPSGLHQGEPRSAAVLIPLLRKENVWHVLLTRRTDTLPEHSGQVAFPGGRVESGDINPEDTALREAREEIGLKPTDVQVLGRLNDFVTITNYRVTPVVGVIPWPFSLHLEKREVSRVFTIPLEWLADPANREEQLRSLPPPYPPVTVIYFHPYDNEILWGASARFTVTLLKILSL